MISVFYEFQHSYKISGQFPESAIARIPPSLVTSIDQGSRGFFTPLQKDFPQVYDVLVQRCRSLQLLEHVVRLSDTPRQHLYCWGAELNGMHLRIGIPSNQPGTTLFKLKFEPMLSCLPSEFRAFYARMDGIGFLESGEIYGRELPLGFPHWRQFTSYLTDHDIAHVPGIKQSFTQTLRLFVETRQRHLILIDGGEARALYCAFSPHYESVYRLENPVKILDDYFAGVVCGNRPDLRDLIRGGEQ